MKQKKKKKAISRPVSAPVQTPNSGSSLSEVWRKREYQVMALTAFLSLIVFGRNVTFSAIPVDLPQMIFNNPNIITGLRWENIYWAFTQPNLALYQPLPNISFMIDSHFFGRWPGGYHTVTLMWHIGCTWAFFWVTLRLVKNFPVAFVAALLMAVHPIQLSVVSQIGARNEAMQALFMLLSIDAYRRYATERSRAAYGYSLLFMLLGLMCKQIIVMLPIALLLLDYWPLRRIEISFREPVATLRAALQLIAEKLPYFALSFVGSYLAVFGKMQYDQISYHVSRLTIPDAIYFVITGYARYVGHLVGPVRLSYFEVYAEEQSLFFFVISVATLVVISAVSLLLLKKRPYLIVGWLWFIALLFPVSGVVRYMLESISIRYLYGAAMGLFIAVSFGYYEFARWLTRYKAASSAESLQGEAPTDAMPKWYWATICVAVAILSGLAFWQNEFLRDTETAVNRMLHVTGGRSSFGHNALAVLRMEEDKFEEAQAHFEQAIAIQPHTYMFRYMYGSALYEKERFWQVVEVMKPAVEADPENPYFLSFYAMGLLGSGRYREAEEYFKTSLALEPGDIPTMHNLAYCLVLQMRYDDAIPLIKQVMAADPENMGIREIAEIVQQESGKPVI